MEVQRFSTCQDYQATPKETQYIELTTKTHNRESVKENEGKDK